MTINNPIAAFPSNFKISVKLCCLYKYVHLIDAPIRLTVFQKTSTMRKYTSLKIKRSNISIPINVDFQ